MQNEVSDLAKEGEPKAVEALVHSVRERIDWRRNADTEKWVSPSFLDNRTATA